MGSVHDGRGHQNGMVWLGVAAAVGLVLMAWAGVFHRTLRPENYPLVQPGMTWKQVEDLLGGPPGDYGWFVVGTGMMTQEGFHAPAGSTEVIWFNDDHGIEVYFDSRGELRPSTSVPCGSGDPGRGERHPGPHFGVVCIGGVGGGHVSAVGGGAERNRSSLKPGEERRVGPG